MMGDNDGRLLGLDRPAANARAPIDHEHLSDFAMGDRALERRFLRLFLEHAQTDMKRMHRAPLDEFRRAAHSLRSSASSVGAWQIVRHTDTILEIDERVAYASRGVLIDELSRSLEQTLVYIRQFVDHE